MVRVRKRDQRVSASSSSRTCHDSLCSQPLEVRYVPMVVRPFPFGKMSRCTRTTQLSASDLFLSSLSCKGRSRVVRISPMYLSYVSLLCISPLPCMACMEHTSSTPYLWRAIIVLGHSLITAELPPDFFMPQSPQAPPSHSEAYSPPVLQSSSRKSPNSPTTFTG